MKTKGKGSTVSFVPRRAFYSKVADELCYCGRKKSEHDGPLHHHGCTLSGCARFTWNCFLDKNGRKLVALLLLLFIGFPVTAHELPNAPIAKPEAVEPKPAVSAPRFYDRQAKIEFGVELAAAAFDAAQTCHNVTNGGREYWLPTQSCAGATAILSAQVAGVELGAYLLHRAHHDKLAHAMRWFAIAQSTRGIVYSKQHGAW